LKNLWAEKLPEVRSRRNPQIFLHRGVLYTKRRNTPEEKKSLYLARSPRPKYPWGEKQTLFPPFADGGGTTSLVSRKIKKPAAAGFANNFTRGVFFLTEDENTPVSRARLIGEKTLVRAFGKNVALFDKRVRTPHRGVV